VLSMANEVGCQRKVRHLSQPLSPARESPIHPRRRQAVTKCLRDVARRSGSTTSPYLCSTGQGVSLNSFDTRKGELATTRISESHCYTTWQYDLAPFILLDN
jgi:hypothetical protein